MSVRLAPPPRSSSRWPAPELARRVADRAGLALSVAAPASCGLATHPGDGTTADELFSRADARVYAAKAARTSSASA